SSSSSSAGTFGAVSVRKINSFLCSSLMYFIWTDKARASFFAFLQEQIGQKRFLQELPLCCFFFSIFSSLTNIINVLQSSMSSRFVSETNDFIKFTNT